MENETAPDATHQLLLALAGRVDDDLLAWARELVAVGEHAHAAELLTASLVTDRAVLPEPVRAGLADAARAAHTGLDAAATLPPARPEDDTAHRFEPGPAVDAVSVALLALPVRQLQGCRVLLTRRVTPAGSAPGPLPHPVVLVEVEVRTCPTDVLAYQLAVALDRAGVRASVEVLIAGATVPAYHAEALRNAHPIRSFEIGDSFLAAADTPVAPAPPAVENAQAAAIADSRVPTRAANPELAEPRRRKRFQQVAGSAQPAAATSASNEQLPNTRRRSPARAQTDDSLTTHMPNLAELIAATEDGTGQTAATEVPAAPHRATRIPTVRSSAAEAPVAAASVPADSLGRDDRPLAPPRRPAGPLNAHPALPSPSPRLRRCGLVPADRPPLPITESTVVQPAASARFDAIEPARRDQEPLPAPEHGRWPASAHARTPTFTPLAELQTDPFGITGVAQAAEPGVAPPVPAEDICSHRLPTEKERPPARPVGRRAARHRSAGETEEIPRTVDHPEDAPPASGAVAPDEAARPTTEAEGVPETAAEPSDPSLRPESLARMLLARLQGELLEGRRLRVSRRAGIADGSAPNRSGGRKSVVPRPRGNPPDSAD